jgi:hypothetical protein
VHPRATVDRVLELAADGHRPAEIARWVGVPASTVVHWCRGDRRGPRDDGRDEACPRCHARPLDETAYSYLLGAYLGDGYINVGRRGVASLSIFCGDGWPGVAEEVREALRAVMPSSSVCNVSRAGCTQIKSYAVHWPCLFPQHGSGRKHTRDIVLAPWQAAIVAEHPGRFLRGLFHSDGCRVTNWATKRTASGVRRYEYPRYHFTNRSEDILGLCTHALDLLGVPWRRSRHDTLSVSKRAAVADLDLVVGPKC